MIKLIYLKSSLINESCGHINFDRNIKNVLFINNLKYTL